MAKHRGHKSGGGPRPRGLFPDPPEKEGRYQNRPVPKDWDLAEDLAILPWMLAADSERDYLAYCRHICAGLGRLPVYGTAARPTIEVQTNDCVALIERRTVTGLLIGRTAWSEFARTYCRGVRGGSPLTWAERNRFLKPYHRKILSGKTHVEYSELFVILDREKGDELPDLARVQGYLEMLTHNPKGAETNFEQNPRKFQEDLIMQTGLWMRRFVENEGKAKTNAWEEYLGCVDELRGI